MVLLTVQMSTLLFGMTITLANVVLPQIRGSLSATQDEISWVITLNLVATAVATPMTGWLASRLGWRNVMFYSVLGFTVSSFLCGIADSLKPWCCTASARVCSARRSCRWARASCSRRFRATCTRW